MDRIAKAAEMAADWWTERLEQGDKVLFRETLRGLVETDLREHGQSRLDCDYDPQGHLLTAVHAAGVECRGCMFSANGILPGKTSLWVRPHVMEPKEGYGNWTKDIPVPEPEQREQIAKLLEAP